MSGSRRRIVAAGAVQLALLGAAACQVAPLEEEPRAEAREASTPIPIEHIVPEGVARLPVFTPAVRVGDLVFLSGAIGTPPSGELRVVEGGAGPETRATMENIGRVLAAAGLGFDDLVKCTVFLADIADYAEMNAVYVTFFEGMEPPARSAMAGSGLALGARVEIECIARGT
ncbi:MAG: RidA family protein [Gemmatimonadota bacterium]|nr:RidA family protein [Gemmatimonadota bacterium]